MAVHGRRILRREGRIPSAQQLQFATQDTSGTGLHDPQAPFIDRETEDFLRPSRRQIAGRSQFGYSQSRRTGETLHLDQGTYLPRIHLLCYVFLLLVSLFDRRKIYSASFSPHKHP